MLQFDVESLSVQPGEYFDLSDRAVDYHPLDHPFDNDEDATHSAREHIADRLDTLVAIREQLRGRRASALFVLHGAAIANRVDLVDHVFNRFDPMTLRVTDCAANASEDRNFLWRAVRGLPVAGGISVMVQSYYAALDAQSDPTRTGRIDHGEVIRSIVDFEHDLLARGVDIIKLFLHTSARPTENTPASQAQRQMLEADLSATSVAAAPWFIVPANRQSSTRAIVAEIALHRLARLVSDTTVPHSDPA